MAPEAVFFIRQVKQALNEAQRKLKRHHFAVSQVELELQTTITSTLGGKLDVKVVSLDFDRSKESVQTLTLTLVPSSDQLVLMSDMADDLVAAIEAIVAAGVEADQTQPHMSMTSATIHLSIGMTSEGHVSVFASGSRSHENAHQLKLDLVPIVKEGARDDMAAPQP